MAGFGCKGHAVVTFLEFALRLSESPCLSFGLIQRQEGKTKIISFDDENTVLINFHMPEEINGSYHHHCHHYYSNFTILQGNSIPSIDK